MLHTHTSRRCSNYLFCIIHHVEDNYSDSHEFLHSNSTFHVSNIFTQALIHNSSYLLSSSPNSVLEYISVAAFHSVFPRCINYISNIEDVEHISSTALYIFSRKVLSTFARIPREVFFCDVGDVQAFQRISRAVNVTEYNSSTDR